MKRLTYFCNSFNKWRCVFHYVGSHGFFIWLRSRANYLHQMSAIKRKLYLEKCSYCFALTTLQNPLKSFCMSLLTGVLSCISFHANAKTEDGVNNFGFYYILFGGFYCNLPTLSTWGWRKQRSKSRSLLVRQNNLLHHISVCKNSVLATYVKKPNWLQLSLQNTQIKNNKEKKSSLFNCHSFKIRDNIDSNHPIAQHFTHDWKSERHSGHLA